MPFLENHSQPGRIFLILLETKRSACQEDILKLSAYGNDGLQHLKHSFPFCFSCIYFVPHSPTVKHSLGESVVVPTAAPVRQPMDVP